MAREPGPRPHTGSLKPFASRGSDKPLAFLLPHGVNFKCVLGSTFWDSTHLIIHRVQHVTTHPIITHPCFSKLLSCFLDFFLQRGVVRVSLQPFGVHPQRLLKELQPHQRVAQFRPGIQTVRKLVRPVLRGQTGPVEITSRHHTEPEVEVGLFTRRQLDTLLE